MPMKRPDVRRVDDDAALQLRRPAAWRPGPISHDVSVRSTECIVASSDDLADDGVIDAAGLISTSL